MYLNPTVAYYDAAPTLAWRSTTTWTSPATQKDWVRERLARAFAWHRGRELPQYRRFLVSVARRADAPFTEAQVALAYTELRGRYHELVEHELQDVAEFLVQLAPAQIAHLERRFADDNDKLTKDSIRGTPEDRRARDEKRMIGHLEEFDGRALRCATPIVALRVGTFAAALEERLADRRYRQMETVALARGRDRVRAVARLHRLLVDTDAWRDPEYRASCAARRGALPDDRRADRHAHASRNARTSRSVSAATSATSRALRLRLTAYRGRFRSAP